MRRLLLVAWLMAGAAAPASGVSAARRAERVHVPVDRICRPSISCAAAPLLVAAYSFIWLAAMFYLWTIWRRLGKRRGLRCAPLEQRRSRQPMTAGHFIFIPCGAAGWHRDRVGARVRAARGRFRRGAERRRGSALAAKGKLTELGR